MILKTILYIKLKVTDDQFVDEAGNGNNEFISAWNFSVDTTDPEVGEPTSPAAGEITSGESITVEFTITDATDISENGTAEVIFDCSGTDVTCTDVTVTDASAGTVQAVILTADLAEDTTYNLKVTDDQFC